jgi:hypothetical protein
VLASCDASTARVVRVNCFLEFVFIVQLLSHYGERYPLPGRGYPGAVTTLYITKELRDELDREKVNPPYKAWDLQIHEAFLRNQYGDAEEKLIADYRSKFSCSRREAIQHLIKEVAEARASSDTTGSDIAGKVVDRIQAELRKRSPGSPLPPSRR